MADRIEVSFNPHGATEPWPHFLANVGDPAEVERLHELGPDGWRVTFIAGGPRGYESADEAVTDPELETRLWVGAFVLTEKPEVEAVVLLPGESAWRPWTEAPRG